MWAWVSLGLFVALVVAVAFAASYRRRLYAEQGRDPGYPIPTVGLHEFDAAFAHGPHGPTLEAEVRFVGVGPGTRGGTSNIEAWVLATLAKKAMRMFEFGTATGRTTYLWARNSPAAARVTTITLGPEDVTQYTGAAGDSRSAARKASRESDFSEFLYTGTEVENKVEQLFGDSKALEVTQYANAMDLIFVDGSHAYSYVKSDSDKAMAMARDGSVILWHDYKGSSGAAKDVYRYLNELHRDKPLVRLAGTSFVALRMRR